MNLLVPTVLSTFQDIFGNKRLKISMQYRTIGYMTN